MLREKIVDLLPHVTRPIQYVGQELNAVRKPWNAVGVRVGLCFPDAYEVGMSHLGLHLLYSLVNARDDVLAERIYAPFPDMETAMRRHGIPLFSLESHQPAAAFDILGFTLQYELSYSNVLNMLALADIPLKAADRSEGYPLILAGGPCSFNPEPLADICDVFVIGDGEHALLQVIEQYQAWKSQGGAKSEFLRRICGLPGVYVPSFYDVHYDAAGCVTAIAPTVPEAPQRIRKALIPDLEPLPYLSAPIVPYLKTVHDRLTLEIMRGCSRGCRFCQAGFIYRPLRERSPESLLALTDALLRKSGYDEVSLSSLSTGDYGQISSLMASLMQTCEAERVSVSLPSMRVSTLTEELASIIRRVRKTGFTIAPEAGTQRLRNVINKGITDEDILQTVEDAFASGWELIKLYFMIGLPTETPDDIEGAIDLVHRVHKLARQVSKKRGSGKRGSTRAKLNVSFSSFVPKAHTPFQWDRFLAREELAAIQRRLQGRIRNRAIQLKWHDADASYLEAIFARGDRRLGRVLVEAQALGCKFDGWREHFDLSAWMQAFERAGLDPDWYAFRQRERDECLPWDHIDAGVSRDYLWQERDTALQAQGSPPCTPHCRRCGLCSDDVAVIRTPPPATASTPLSPDDAGPEPRIKAFRLRLVFSKTGLLRFLSHLDLGRVFHRAIARIHAPVAYSQGYNPHPLLSFGPALPVGMEGLRELIDIFFSQPVEPANFIDAMNATLPEGIAVHAASVINMQAPSLSAELTRFVFQITFPASLWEQPEFSGTELQRRCQAFHAQESWMVAPFKKRADGLDFKCCLTALDVHLDAQNGPRMEIAAQMHDNVVLKPEDVLHLVFHIPYEQILDCRIVRIMCT